MVRLPETAMGADVAAAADVGTDVGAGACAGAGAGVSRLLLRRRR